jgi:hypothetical protein
MVTKLSKPGRGLHGDKIIGNLVCNLTPDSLGIRVAPPWLMAG